jgi:predicted Rdx family selenoprotein
LRRNAGEPIVRFPSCGLHPAFEEAVMPRFLIERNIPGAGALSAQELQAISQKSCSVLQGLGPQIQWVQSFVTDDKITCLYIAPNAELIREHARQGGFPADAVLEVRNIIDPTTAESFTPPVPVLLPA